MHDLSDVMSDEADLQAISMLLNALSALSK